MHAPRTPRALNSKAGLMPQAPHAVVFATLLGMLSHLLTMNMHVLCLPPARLLPQWVAAGDHPASCQALLPQLPAANAGTLKLLMQVSPSLQTVHAGGQASACLERWDNIENRAVTARAGMRLWREPAEPQQQYRAHIVALCLPASKLLFNCSQTAVGPNVCRCAHSYMQKQHRMRWMH